MGHSAAGWGRGTRGPLKSTRLSGVRGPAGWAPRPSGPAPHPHPGEGRRETPQQPHDPQPPAAPGDPGFPAAAPLRARPRRDAPRLRQQLRRPGERPPRSPARCVLNPSPRAPTLHPRALRLKEGPRGGSVPHSAAHASRPTPRLRAPPRLWVTSGRGGAPGGRPAGKRGAASFSSEAPGSASGAAQETLSGAPTSV